MLESRLRGSGLQADLVCRFPSALCPRLRDQDSDRLTVKVSLGLVERQTTLQSLGIAQFSFGHCSLLRFWGESDGRSDHAQDETEESEQECEFGSRREHRFERTRVRVWRCRVSVSVGEERVCTKECGAGRYQLCLDITRVRCR